MKMVGQSIRMKNSRFPQEKHHSYAFCSDTKYDEELIKWIRGVDLLYHEATFMDEMKERAYLTFHTTAKQAGCIATAASSW